MNTLLFSFIVAVGLVNQALTAAVPASGEPKPESLDVLKKTFSDLSKNVDTFIKNFQNASETQVPAAINELINLVKAHSRVFSSSTKSSFENVAQDLKETGSKVTDSVTNSKSINDLNTLFFSIANDISTAVQKHKDDIPSASQITENINNYVNKMTEKTDKKNN